MADRNFSITLFRPQWILARAKTDLESDREFILRVFFTIICIYFLYGVYALYTSGRLSW